jgi:hypothetical protein
MLGVKTPANVPSVPWGVSACLDSSGSAFTGFLDPQVWRGIRETSWGFRRERFTNTENREHGKPETDQNGAKLSLLCFDTGFQKAHAMVQLEAGRFSVTVRSGRD